MLLAGVKPHHIPRMDFLATAVPTLNSTTTRSNNQGLPQWVRMPRRARPRFKRDTSSPDCSLPSRIFIFAPPQDSVPPGVNSKSSALDKLASFRCNDWRF